MAVRFDEVELFKGADGEPSARDLEDVRLTESGPVAAPAVRIAASRSRRVLAFATDASLFVALGLALSPLLEIRATFADTLLAEPFAIAGFSAFLLLVSYYYFVATWVVWGKTVGGSIFDIRVASASGHPIDVRSATVRGCAILLSILTGGLGFVIAVVPGGRSLADLMSRSRSWVSH
jgi:uncharacterized RDD family membrane protein YckC